MLFRSITTVEELYGRWSLANNEQQIIWNQSLSQVSPGDTIILNAYATSGLAVIYTTDETESIELRDDTLIAKTLGYAQIIAEQHGDDTYLKAPSVRAYVMISEPTIYIEESIQESVYIYPNPANEGFYLHGCDVEKILLTDAVGRAVTILHSDKSTSPYFTLPTLPPGVYKLHLRSATEYHILVLIVK